MGLVWNFPGIPLCAKVKGWAKRINSRRQMCLVPLGQSPLSVDGFCFLSGFGSRQKEKKSGNPYEHDMKTRVHLLLLFKAHPAPWALGDVSGTFETDEESVAQQQDRFFSKPTSEAQHVITDVVWWKCPATSIVPGSCGAPTQGEPPREEFGLASKQPNTFKTLSGVVSSNSVFTYAVPFLLLCKTVTVRGWREK